MAFDSSHPEQEGNQVGGQAAPERREGRTWAEGRRGHEWGLSSATTGGAGFDQWRVDEKAPVSGAEQ